MELNYEVKLSSIDKLEFALVKGVGLADIKDLSQFSFNQADSRPGSYGKVPVYLNEVVIFRLNRDKCFAFSPVRVEDSGVIKTASMR